LSLNVVVDTTKAYLSNASYTGTDLSLRAFNNTTIATIGGALAIAATTQDSKGIAGSVAINVVASTADTRVQDSAVALSGDLDVVAKAESELMAVAISGTGVSGTFGLAGSVTLNVASMPATAFIASSSVTAHDVTVTATETNTFGAVAGAGALAVS